MTSITSEECVPGISAAPTFQTHSADSWEETVRRLSDPAERQLSSFTPRDFLRDDVLPRPRTFAVIGGRC